jgi:hypothetical protein
MSKQFDVSSERFGDRHAPSWKMGHKSTMASRSPLLLNRNIMHPLEEGCKLQWTVGATENRVAQMNGEGLSVDLSMLIKA